MRVQRIHRHGECVSDGPSVPDTSAERCRIDACMTCPIGEAHGATVVVDADVSSRVAKLFSGCGPSHVSGCIGTVVVDSVDGMPNTRTAPDVGKERREVAVPRSAHLDTAPTISSELTLVGVIAARSHAQPDLKFRGARPAKRFSVGAIGVDAQAAAASDLLRSQMIRSNDALDPAVAFTQPHRHSFLRPVSRHDRQATEPLTAQVLEVVNRHGLNSRLNHQIWGPR